jgi:FMN-dependent NADH-azoreductase
MGEFSNMKSKIRVLRVDASASVSTSNSKKLGDALIARMEALHPGMQVQQRDLNEEISLIDEAWVGANFTAPEERSEMQKQRLEFSDQLIDEIRHADHIVLTTPMYNFSIPAPLKAWIDLICRAGVTFQYSADGPVGLLKNKRVDIIMTTGGVPLQSPADFSSDYLKQIFRFIGIEDINIFAADQMSVDADASYQNALDQMARSYAMSTAA